MEGHFSGKRALLTGAAGAIGRALTLKLVSAGCQVVALGTRKESLQSLSEEVSGTVEVLQVEDPLDWESVAEAAESCGPLDLLVNCALLVPDAEKDPDGQGIVDRILGTNLKAIINLSQAVSGGMRERGGGSVVNVFSQRLQQSQAFPGLLSYCCAKSALDLATKVLALDLAPHRIRVNAVNPTLIERATSRRVMALDPDSMEELLCHTPMGAMADPERVSDAILFLLSDLASTVSGVTLNVDAGASYLG